MSKQRLSLDTPKTLLSEVALAQDEPRHSAELHYLLRHCIVFLLSRTSRSRGRPADWIYIVGTVTIAFFFYCLHSHHLIFYEGIRKVDEERYPLPTEGISFG